jgi:hypothetical protein
LNRHRFLLSMSQPIRDRALQKNKKGPQKSRASQIPNSDVPAL